MAIEQARVGEVAARMLDILDEYGYGEDAEITDVLLITAVNDGDGATNTHYSVSPGMPAHVGVGLCTLIQRAMVNPS